MIKLILIYLIDACTFFNYRQQNVLYSPAIFHPFEINSDITDDIVIENPIPARADKCIVLESKHQQARCRFLRRFKSSILLLSK